MRPHPTSILIAALVSACSVAPERQTLSELNGVEIEVREVRIEDGLDQAMSGYRSFLEETPDSTLTPEAMRRLADLKVEKEFGLLGDGNLIELPAPESAALSDKAPAASGNQSPEPQVPVTEEADALSASPAQDDIRPEWSDAEAELPGGRQESPEWAGPLEAIELYDQILATYPHYENNDQVLYQKARAYDELGRTEEAMAVMDQLVAEHPESKYTDEVQFRRAEYFFTRKKYLDAEQAYSAIVVMGETSEYYELALYKLGWTLYKQDFHEEALHKYMALLDYKVSVGYDFDQVQEEADERRVADTYRVISLSFSNLGGPDAVEDYFAVNGHRSYEDRIYSHLAEFYFEKLRYHDAAIVYKAFVRLNPLHQASPHFSMRVVEIYEAGGFPKLVLESKKDFASNYGLQSEYWRHFDAVSSPEVLNYLKANLTDLANHYHALYQEESLADEQPANYQEALYWYHSYLESFPDDDNTPGMNYQLADLLMEHQDFGGAALEYERTAYEYAPHERAGAAGYAAIYAHREHEKVAVAAERSKVRRDAVESTIRFVDAFPEHEHAAVVLGAAVDDMYDMKEFERAIATAHRLIDNYPSSSLPIQRSAWTVIAHSSFDLAAYAEAEGAYSRVIEMTDTEDEARPDLIDNLAASIYKQGEQANVMEDYRAAADHFLRVRQVAPTSDIRASAEYDAAAALIRLEDWTSAGQVLESFRQTFPDHELQQDATKQLAMVYREDGQLSHAAAEYERVSEEAGDPELSREALLVAGDLYDEAGATERALDVYQRYVTQFPDPIEIAVETRFKIAGMHQGAADLDSYHRELREIVDIDALAGDQRTPRIRFLAAQSALVLSEDLYQQFGQVDLVQPFEQSLQEKQKRMDAALAALESLVDYEVGEVTAAATFYIAEIYMDFSQSLVNSERPTDLGPAELQDYELVIEEEAFPFEERAIEVHEKNLELMVAGLYNPWIEKSLDKLADLMPGRYAKFEISSGFIDSIDGYAYQSPARPDRQIDDSTDGPTTPSEDAEPAADPDTQPDTETNEGVVGVAKSPEVMAAG
jgi:TolA-binding protein